MKRQTAVVYLHGRGGSADEAAHYRRFFAGCDVIGFDYKAQTPWDARAEFPSYFHALSKTYASICLIANSLGAYFAMHALAVFPFEQAFFISPVVDMEALILQMMRGANVTEAELRERGAIPTASGETLSWEYLAYVRANPVEWTAPTHILYGERDELTPPDVMAAFAERIGASLTVAPDCEHWFHTPEQMAVLDHWMGFHRGLYF